MKKQRDRLTPDEQRAMENWRDEWLKLGRSTERLNLKETKKAIAFTYKQIGKKVPPVWYCLSPLQACLIAPIVFKLFGRKEQNLRANLSDNLYENLDANLHANLRDNLRENLDANLHANLRDNLRDNLRVNLSDNLRANLDVNLYDNLRDNLRENLDVNLSENLRQDAWKVWLKRSTQIWWWTGWYAFASFPIMFMGLDIAGAARSLLDQVFHLLRNTHVYIPLPDLCIVSERPCILKIDDRGRLHSEKGPALAYLDGYGFYCWHGVRVKAHIVDKPETITIQEIEKEKNVEIRRIMIERYGSTRFYEDCGAKKISSDDYGILYRKELEGDEPLVFVKVVNSTAEPDGTYKDYILRVPPNTKTAHEAVAWTFGLSIEKYEPAVQT